MLVVAHGKAISDLQCNEFDALKRGYGEYRYLYVFL